MTKTDNAAPQVALKLCPFCGAMPGSAPNSAVKGGVILIHFERTMRDHADRDCPLAGQYFRPDEWNQRALTRPDDARGLVERARNDALREAAEAVGDLWHRLTDKAEQDGCRAAHEAILALATKGGTGDE